MRIVKLLSFAYLGLSLATIVAIFLLRDHPSLVNDVAVVRCAIVVLSAVVTTLFAVQAGRGSRKACRRLRVVASAMTVAIVVIVAWPGLLPAWVRVEQGVCGLLLLSVVVLLRAERVRRVTAS